MKRIGFLLLIGLLGLTWAACRKSHSQPTWTPGMDIYFVGADTGQAVSWKNGVRTVLGKGVANGITVSGGSVYVSGTAYMNGFTTVATLWMDGTEHVLADTTTFSGANTPVVFGTDVYVPVKAPPSL